MDIWQPSQVFRHPIQVPNLFPVVFIAIAGVGVELMVTRTVVRDTRPQESDDTLGVGIGSRGDPTTGTNGSLTVSQSLIAGNRTVGILAFSRSNWSW